MSRHAPSPEFDPRIADWLENDPDEAPGRILETVLAAFPSIPQRRASRVPWRPTWMSTQSRVAAAAVMAVLLVGGVLLIARPDSNGVGGPSASPSPSSTPSSPVALTLDGGFTSQRYGFDLKIPTGWTLTPSIRNWAAGISNDWGSGYNDELATSTIRFSGASQDLLPGQAPDAWLREYARPNPVDALGGSGGDFLTWPIINIGGAPGHLAVDGRPVPNGIPAGSVYFDAVLVLDGRGYDFSMDGIVDRAMFEAILATVNFPRVARLDQTFTSALHGYSVRYPAAWSVSPATRTWQAAQMKPSSWTADAATSDVLGVVPWFEGRSTPLPAGQRFEEWYAAYAATRARNTCTGNPTLEETVMVDGVVGRLDRHCEEYFLEVVVPKGDRVYVFTLYEPNAPLDFSGMLDSIVLTPSTAKR